MPAPTRGGASAAGTRVNGSATGTLSFTTGGTAPYLVVPVMMAGGFTAVSSVTFGSTSLSLIEGASAVTSGNGRRTEIWGGYVPAATDTISVNAGTSGDFIIGAEYYTGVTQATTAFTRTSTSGTVWYGTSVTLDAVPESILPTAVSYAGEVTATPDARLTAGGENESGLGSAAGAWGYQDGTVSQTNTMWTLGSSQSFAVVIVRLSGAIPVLAGRNISMTARRRRR